jgi:hypothetical protein
MTGESDVRPTGFRDGFENRSCSVQQVSVTGPSSRAQYSFASHNPFWARTVFSSTQASTPKDAWRGSPSWGHHVGAADLLKFLADNGYPLSDVERVMVGERTSEGVYSEYCS